MDGTLCDEKNFPEIGTPKMDIIEWCKNQKGFGHKLILWTAREGKFLLDAIAWCSNYGLKFDAVNQNIMEMENNYFGKHKIIADIYLDDKSLKLSDLSKYSDIITFERGK